MRFPLSHRWTLCVTTKSPKRWLKTRLFTAEQLVEIRERTYIHTNSSPIADESARRAASRQRANFWTVTWPWPRPFRKWYVLLLVTLAIAYLCNKFDNSSFSYSRGIFRALKFKVNHVTWPRLFQRQFVVRRLRLTMINLHTKFEMSTITCNEDMKGNAKYVKILVLSHPLGT